MRSGSGRLRVGLWTLCLMLFVAGAANATTFKKQANIVDLLGQSELILHGTVKNITDGIDSKGLPYTEVTIHVSEAIKGQSGTEYTFRQFGLLKPRSMGNGLTNLMVTPAAFANYTKGEETLLFLYKQAGRTGFRTTTGLGQGKFNISVAGAVNQFNNAGLFNGVVTDQTLLGTTEKRVMATKTGAVNAQGFVSLVKQAVNGKWVENGRMKNAKKK
jgi:hypothetical protein